jgi:hypothetical protein
MALSVLQQISEHISCPPGKGTGHGNSAAQAVLPSRNASVLDCRGMDTCQAWAVQAHDRQMMCKTLFAASRTAQECDEQQRFTTSQRQRHVAARGEITH